VLVLRDGAGRSSNRPRSALFANPSTTNKTRTLLWRRSRPATTPRALSTLRVAPEKGLHDAAQRQGRIWSTGAAAGLWRATCEAVRRRAPPGFGIRATADRMAEVFPEVGRAAGTRLCTSPIRAGTRRVADCSRRVRAPRPPGQHRRFHQMPNTAPT